MKVQSALLKMCDPMTCMWAELIDNNQLRNLGTTLNIHDILNVVHHILVMLGNANELFSQLWCSKFLAAVDTSLIRSYMKVSSKAPTGESLQKKFTCYSTIIPTATIFLLTIQSTICNTKNQFCRGGPARKWGPQQGSCQTPSSYR